MEYLTMVLGKITQLTGKADEGYTFLNSLLLAEGIQPAERIHLESCRANHRMYVEVVAYARLLSESKDFPSDVIDTVKKMEESSERTIKRLDDLAELIAGNMRIVKLGERDKKGESDGSSATP